MSAHTPGPWFLFNEGRCVAGPESQPGLGQGVAMCHMRARSDEEAKANARLIAAAPELLDALRSLTNSADGLSFREEGVRSVVGNTNWRVLREHIDAARAVIAKAVIEAAP